MSKTNEILKALGFQGQDEISKIIKSYDHDLKPIELEAVRETLSEPEVLEAFKKFTSKEDVDENLMAQAEQKLENIKRQNPDVGSFLQGLPVYIFYVRRRTEFYQFIVDHSEAEIIKIGSEVQDSFNDGDITPLKSSALKKRLGVSDMTRGEDGAYGVWKYLNRKRATQGAARMVEWAKNRQK